MNRLWIILFSFSIWLPTSSAMMGELSAWQAEDGTDTCIINRQLRNLRHHYPDPSDCHCYYQCFYLNETFAVGIKRYCPEGTFWREAVSQCLPESSIPCEDACLDEVVHAKGSYPGKGCRQYFVCVHTASHPMCCPDGTAFDPETRTCQRSDTCFDVCEQKEAPTERMASNPAVMIADDTCQDSWGAQISAVPGDRRAYQLKGTVDDNIPKLYCPAGLIFDLKTCTCNYPEEDGELRGEIPQTTTIRQALVWLNFDENTNDASVQKFSTVLYDGAERDASDSAWGGGSLLVNNGFLAIPGLMGYDSGNEGSWCAFYKPENAQSTGGILSNSRDSSLKEYTVIMAVDSAKSFVSRLNLRNSADEDRIVQATNGANGWNHACLVYDGTTMQLYNNGKKFENVDGGGPVWVSQAPMIVGSDPTYGSFSGRIDDVLITTFAMTEQEVEAHATGNRKFLADQGFW